MMYLVFFMGLVAVWVAGQISAEVQAALGMVNQCGILLMVVAMAISSGATAAVSQSLGALKVARAQRYVATTVLGCFALGFVVALFGWYFGDAILVMLSPLAVVSPKAVAEGLVDIARRHRISVQSLIEANKLDSRATIRLGQSLLIPGRSEPSDGKKAGGDKRMTSRAARQGAETRAGRDA